MGHLPLADHAVPEANAPAVSNHGQRTTIRPADAIPRCSFSLVRLDRLMERSNTLANDGEWEQHAAPGRYQPSDAVLAFLDGL
jgi:hypothetical protein